jgi:hypothetical protein
MASISLYHIGLCSVIENTANVRGAEAVARRREGRSVFSRAKMSEECVLRGKSKSIAWKIYATIYPSTKSTQLTLITVAVMALPNTRVDKSISVLAFLTSGLNVHALNIKYARSSSEYDRDCNNTQQRSQRAMTANQKISAAVYPNAPKMPSSHHQNSSPWAEWKHAEQYILRGRRRSPRLQRHNEQQ